MDPPLERRRRAVLSQEERDVAGKRLGVGPVRGEDHERRRTGTIRLGNEEAAPAAAKTLDAQRVVEIGGERTPHHVAERGAVGLG
jgi:hypothetical protein